LICRFDFDFDFGQGRPPTFEIYVLEDEEQEQGVRVERTAATTDLNLEYEVRIK